MMDWTPTTFRYTGQRQESGLGGAEGLYYYGARWYDPTLGRFAQADSIVPEPNNPQSLNRFSYSLSNPLNYTDPSGHTPVGDEPPPVTIDDENGLCINVWNIGCSGTVESNLEWVEWNFSMLPYEILVRVQDIAKSFSSKKAQDIAKSF
jgi:RHS repeat-associated protein